MLIELQRAMASAALGGDRQPALALLHRDSPAGRLAVYRNTVLGGLADVLAAAYPSVAHTLGCETFQRAGRGFGAISPPAEPQLWNYGEGFAEFLAAQPEERVPPWLPDLARLDRAMHEAYFAADADQLDPGRAADLTRLADLSGVRFALHPSLRVVASDWPIYRLWRTARDGLPMPGVSPSPEAVMVARPRHDVLCRLLTAWEAGFIGILLSAGTLGCAAAHSSIGCAAAHLSIGCAAAHHSFPDTAAAVETELVTLLQLGLIIGFSDAV